MLRCSPEAFAQCPTRHICGNIQEATFMEGSECDLFNRSVADKPLTNGDRIRAMSDEELVELARKQIGGGFDWIPCGVVCGGKCTTTNSEECRKRILHWLQQPVENGVRLENSLENKQATSDEAAPVWIPVTERVPESPDFVAALTTGGDRIIAQRDKYGWLRYGGYECEKLRPITHWMPLPKPPKEDK